MRPWGVLALCMSLLLAGCGPGGPGPGPSRRTWNSGIEVRPGRGPFAWWGDAGLGAWRRNDWVVWTFATTHAEARVTGATPEERDGTYVSYADGEPLRITAPNRIWIVYQPCGGDAALAEVVPGEALEARACGGAR